MMTDALQVLTFLVLHIFLLKSGSADRFDDLMPTIMKRAKEVQEVLISVPKDVQTEFMYHVASYYIPVDSETELCRNHSAIMYDAFLSDELWALRMVDASSKLSPGVMDGRMMDLGSYRQCLSVEAPHGLFRGQHCVVETMGLMPPEMDFLNPWRAPLPVLRTDVMFSVCVPSSCTAQDVKTHIDVSLNSVNASAIMYNTSCSSAASEPLVAADYLAICVVILFIIAIVTSTFYDNFNSKTEKSELLSSFSLTFNTTKLLAPDHSKDSLPCLNGLRVLAMAWVLLGHRLLHYLILPSMRVKDFSENMTSLGWAPMQEVQLSVEIFFLMSGILVTYNFLKDRKKGTTFSYFSFFSRRYRRLTPALAFMVLLYATIIIRLTDGPIWKRLFGLTREYCERNWWATLYYVSNYANPYEICIPQTWYLTADFQMHMLAPLLLFPLSTHRPRGFFCVSVAFVATTTAAMAYAVIMELPGAGPFRTDQRRAGDVVHSYVQTQYRAGSFLIGMLLGYLLFKIKHEQNTVTFSKAKLWTGWIVAVSLIIISIFGIVHFVDERYNYNPWVDPAYHVLHRYTLSLGVTWIILVCTIGQGGFVNKILSWNALLPLSRLTYGVYLVHYVLQDIQTLRTKSAVTTDTFSVWYLFFADLLFSYILAVALYLAVEAPFNNIFSYIFKDSNKRKSMISMSQPDMLPSLTTVETSMNITGSSKL